MWKFIKEVNRILPIYVKMAVCQSNTRLKWEPLAFAKHVSINLYIPRAVYTRVSCLTTENRTLEGPGNSLVITEVTPGRRRLIGCRRESSLLLQWKCQRYVTRKPHGNESSSLKSIVYLIRMELLNEEKFLDIFTFISFRVFMVLVYHRNRITPTSIFLYIGIQKKFRPYLFILMRNL